MWTLSETASGLPVPPLGLGLGGKFALDPSAASTHVAAVHLALDLGIRLLDTAEVYAEGGSETLLGRALRGRRDQAWIATKVRPEHLAKADLIRACEGSLQRLGTDRIDLYQVHWPNPAVPLEETAEALLQLHREGKIRHIGVSNFPVELLEQMEAALGAQPLFSVQSEYNLGDRTLEDRVLPHCAARGLKVLAYSPLDQGRLVAHAGCRAALTRIAAAHGTTPTRAALQFLMSRPGVVPIPSSLNPAHLAENARALTDPLPQEALARIDEECRIRVEAVPWTEIRPIPDPTGQHSVPLSLEEARRNPMGLCPSPLELAEEIRQDDRIKPIRIAALPEAVGPFRYDLVEGRLRFWAWVLAFEGRRPVPALVRS